MKAVYKDAVRHFRLYKAEIQAAWQQPTLHSFGCLFAFCTPTGRVQQRFDKINCGCPLMIRRGTHHGWTKDLTKRISEDARLAKSIEELEDCGLVALAEWQDLMDLTIRNADWRSIHDETRRLEIEDINFWEE